MKLIRFGETGKEKPGVIIGEQWYDVSACVQDYNEDFFEQDGLTGLQHIIENNTGLAELSREIRLGCPVAGPSKIICIGLNYTKHAIETKAPFQKNQLYF